MGAPSAADFEEGLTTGDWRVMSTHLPWHIDLLPWYVFAAYWGLTALTVKRAKVTEKSADRLATLAVMVTAFVLLFYEWPSTGPLRLHFAPAERWIVWFGVAITTLGVVLAIWARRCLGEYWSARVTLKQDHQLIRSGPYRYVRHPIYTGMLLGAVGRAITIGEWRGVLAVALILVAHSRKALREQRMLAGEFGEEYARYCGETGFLFPRVWPNSRMDTRSKHP